MKLTNEQLDAVIEKTNKIYDQKVGLLGANYNVYHDIAMVTCVLDGLIEHISQYDARVVDDRVAELAGLDDDHDCDADLDAYSRRFDCEV